MAATFDYSLFTQVIVGLSLFYCDPTGTWWERVCFMSGASLFKRERTHAQPLELMANLEKNFEKLTPMNVCLINTRQYYIVYQHMQLGGRDFLVARFYQYGIDEPIWEDIVGRAI